LADTPCCAGMSCERHLMGTHNKQCVAAPTPAPQCKARGEICGCAGCLTQTCCDGLKCLEAGGQGGKLFCVDAPDAMLEGSVELVRSSAAEATSTEQCVQEFASCGGPGLADQPCCGGMQCVRSFVGTEDKQCVATTTTSPQCVKEFGTCGGPGLQDQACCDGMQCERSFVGTDNKQCVASPTPAPQCKARGEVCGCSGCSTQTCCDGLKCLEAGGQGGKLFCVDAPDAMLEGTVELARSSAAGATSTAQCVQEFASCGGPGLADQSCCGGMHCVRSFVGTEDKQCVATTTTSPQCVQEFGTCGGPGLQDQPCCDGMQCERSFVGTHDKQCVAATTTTVAPQCKRAGEICGCAGCHTQACCNGSECLEVAGQGGQQYCVSVNAIGHEGEIASSLSNVTAP